MDGIIGNSDSPIPPEEEAFPVIEQSPFDQTLRQKHQYYIEEANRRKREMPERYEGHSLAQRILAMEEEEKSKEIANGLPGNQATNPSTQLPMEAEVTSPKLTPFVPSNQPTSTAGQQASPDNNAIDFYQIWMNSNVATAIIHIETGQLLKGNSMFMR